MPFELAAAAIVAGEVGAEAAAVGEAGAAVGAAEVAAAGGAGAMELGAVEAAEQVIECTPPDAAWIEQADADLVEAFPNGEFPPPTNLADESSLEQEGYERLEDFFPDGEFPLPIEPSDEGVLESEDYGHIEDYFPNGEFPHPLEPTGEGQWHEENSRDVTLKDGTGVKLPQPLGDTVKKSAENVSKTDKDDSGESPIEKQQEVADEAAQQYNKKYHPVESAKRKGCDDVTETKNGGVSFEESDALYVTDDGEPGIVKIEATGNREDDFDRANEALGLEETPDGYVWHHVDDYDVGSNTFTMQLVKTEAHQTAIPHSGGCAQYDAVHGATYNPPRKEV